MTKKAESHELLLEAAGRLLQAEQNFRLAYTAIEGATAGYRSNTMPNGTGASTDTHPERYETITRDRAATALAELNHHVRLAFASAAAVDRIIATWTPHTATPDEQRAAALTTLDPADWCANCLRIAKCAPRHRGDLCRWCYDFKTANRHRLPPLELLRMHHEGRRITEDRIKDALRIRAS